MNGAAGQTPVARTKLTEEVVQIGLPEKVIVGEGARAFEYKYSVTKGSVPVLVRGDARLFKGKKVSAVMELWKENFSDGKSSLKIELSPNCTLLPRYRLCVTNAQEVPPSHQRQGTKTFSVPEPLQGMVILSPIKNK